MTSTTVMQDVHLRGLDLNLFVARDALIVERSVARAAQRLRNCPGSGCRCSGTSATTPTRLDAWFWRSVASEAKAI